VVLLTGCSGGGATELVLRDWTLTGPGTTAQVTLPTHVGNALPKSRAHYFLRRTVTLGPALRGHDLVLVIPRLLAHVTLRVDGHQEVELEPDDARSFRGQGPHAFRIPASTTSKDALALEIDVDHTWTQSGWVDTVPRLTTAPDGGAAFVWQWRFNDFAAWTALGFAFFAGFIYFVIFLTDTRRRGFLWFALTGAGGTFYPLFETGIAARVLGPMETTMAACGISVAVVAQLHFTYAEFRLERPHRAWDVACAVSVLASILSTGYFSGTQVGGLTTVLLAVPAVAAQATLFVRLSRRKPHPFNLVLVLAGWVAVSVIGPPDFVAWAGLGELLGGLRPACLAITAIAICQIVALSREHTRSLRRADELAKEREERILLLEKHTRDVELLNDELRRQIGARSRVLADALSREAGGAEAKVFAEGEVVEGRYRVIRALGEGAAGTVYLVERRSDSALLAMKVVRGATDRHALARLAREAQLAAEVKHENVITVVDVDFAATGTGFLYVVMEYVSGYTLRDQKKQFGAMKWSLDVLRQIASGLASVHARGIVHRDLKPANVLLVPREGRAPLVKIADFGIAGVTGQTLRDERATLSNRPLAARSEAAGLLASPDDLRLTQTGVLLGTPLYMAPEAIDGAKNAAPSTDMFSFGVIAYEVLTSALPFADSPALAQLQGVSVAPPRPTGELKPELPPSVARLIDRCLSFDASERPTAAEARDVLSDARIQMSA
jgi:serine/threonine-protein kinase